jgi:hypothetical protein
LLVVGDPIPVDLVDISIILKREVPLEIPMQRIPIVDRTGNDYGGQVHKVSSPLGPYVETDDEYPFAYLRSATAFWW